MNKNAALDTKSLNNVSRTKLNVLRKFKGKEGFFLKTFFANTIVNLNKWAFIDQAALEDALDSALDVKRFPKSKAGNPQTAPTIMRSDFGHPPDDSPDIITEQEPDRVGDFIDIDIDKTTKNAFTVSEITKPLAIEMLENGEIGFTSPSFEVISGFTDKDGNFIITKGRVNHNALVKKPAFGTFAAQIRGRCSGDRETCLHQLSSVQAAICVKMKGKNVCINTTEDEMQITDDVTASICGETGNTIINIKKGSKLDECVQRILSKKLDTNEKPTPQDLAIAFSECREKNASSESLKTKMSTKEAMTRKANEDDLKRDPEEMEDKDKNATILALRASIVKAQEDKKIDDDKIVKKEEATKIATKATQDEIKEKEKKRDEELQAMHAEIKGPMVAEIVTARIKYGQAKKGEEDNETKKLMDKPIDELKSLKADYKALDGTLQTNNNNQQSVRYTMQAAEKDNHDGEQLLTQIRGRLGT